MKDAMRRLVCLLVLLATGCGGAAPSSQAPKAAQGGRAFQSAPGPDRDGDGIMDSNDHAPEEPAPAPAGNLVAAPAPAPPPPPPGAPAPTSTSTPVAQGETRELQLLIYTARVTLAVYQVDRGLAEVERIARESGGYLSQKRDQEITIRVPRARFEGSLAAIDKIGDVVHRDIQAQDVTDEFVDTEIRVRNARAMQARLRQLLERAPVKEALEIEKELARVTQEIELLEGKLKLLRDKIAYSTITVSFQPRGSTIQATRLRLPFPWLSSLGLPGLLTLQEDR